MYPFNNFSLTKFQEGTIRITFDYTHVVGGFDHAYVMLLEQDGQKDNWSLRQRDYVISTLSGSITSKRLSYYNETYNDFITIPTNTSGDRDDHGRRLFLKPLAQPLGADEVRINAYYTPGQIDPTAGLEFYALVAIVAVANRQPVAVLGDYIVSNTISV